jgi:hypothetical protein
MATERSTAESQDAGASSEAYEKPLKESLEDASVLLWYATREGKEVSKETISDIVLAQSSLSAGTRNAEIEGRFWGALRELAAAIKPASIDSILATYSYPFGQHGESGKRRLVDAAATKKKYSLAALVVLVLLLVVQIYWFMGTTFRADLESHRNELDHIAGSLREMHLNGKTQNASTNGDQTQANIAQVKPMVSSEMVESIKPLTSDTHDNPATSNVITDYINATNRSFRVQRMLMGDSWMMRKWDFVTWLAGEPAEGLEQRTDNQASNAAQASESSDKNLLSIDDTLFADQLKVELALLNSKSMLAILSQYVLPLLYGLLGALAYILRTLSSEIQSVTFTRGSEIRYSLRWPLGMLGGVTVGLFFDPAQLSGFAAITPLGLAFLAGYGVELLFTGLDRLVSAFTGENSARPKAA